MNDLPGKSNLPYVLELPELDYDPRQLSLIIERNESAWKRFETPGKVWDFYELRFPGLSNEPHIRHITSQITDVIKCSDQRLAFNKIYPNDSFDVHIDPGRSSAVIFGIEPVSPSEVFWQDDDGNILHKHVYTVPSIINTKITHGVFNDDRTRINFQISIHLPFDEIIDMYRNGTLITSKQRME